MLLGPNVKNEYMLLTSTSQCLFVYLMKRKLWEGKANETTKIKGKLVKLLKLQNAKLGGDFFPDGKTWKKPNFIFRLPLGRTKLERMDTEVKTGNPGKNLQKLVNSVEWNSVKVSPRF